MIRRRVFHVGIVALITIAALWAAYLPVAAAPPANDDFDSATDHGGDSFTDNLDTREATTAGDDPFPFCGGGREATVWYAFTPGENRLVDINTYGSSYTAVVSVYIGGRGSLDQLTCDFEQARFRSSANQTYFIMIGAYSGSYPSPGGPGGDQTFSFYTTPLPPPPENDDIDFATAIVGNSYTATVDTREATVASDDSIPSSSMTPPTTQVTSVSNHRCGIETFNPLAELVTLADTLVWALVRHFALWYKCITYIVQIQPDCANVRDRRRFLPSALENVPQAGMISARLDRGGSLVAVSVEVAPVLARCGQVVVIQS